MQRKNISVLGLLAIFVGIIWAIFSFPTTESVYQINYVMDVFCILTVIVLLLSYASKKGFYVFEPLYYISTIYSFMYFVTPIYDILTQNYTWYGYSLFQYGVKSSIVALLGYVGFYVVYSYRMPSMIDYSQDDQIYQQDDYPSKITVPFIIFMYLFCFVANVYYMLQSGYTSLLYILSLGIIGGSGGNASATSDAIGYISMFSYCLPTITMLYWEYGRSIILKLLLFVPMLMLQITRGFRFFVIQIAVSFFAYYYIKTNKKIKLRTVLLSIIVLMIPILLMTVFRNSVRAGGGVDLSIVNGELIQKSFEVAFWDNFRIYQNVYGVVAAVPSQSGYVFGRQMVIGTIVMMIPRALWTNKISSYGGLGLRELIGDSIASGQAYPNVGEYYYSFGIIGVIFWMGLYAWWMKKETIKGGTRKYGPLSNIAYCILLGTNLQLIIRGYTPSNFWYVVFALLPVFFVRIINKQR